MKILNKHLQGYVFCDFEATGVSDDDLPIEVGLVFCDKYLDVLEEYESLIWWEGMREKDVENETFKIHKITYKEFASNSECYEDVGKNIVEITNRLYHNKKPVICSDCLNFEWNHMRNIIVEEDWPFHYCGRDIGVLTDFLGKEMKITKHRALADARVVRENLIRILDKIEG